MGTAASQASSNEKITIPQSIYMLKLKLIVTSTRPGRKGYAIAEAFLPIIKTNPAFETELVDLADLKLPVFDEPNHPRLKQYTKEHTKKWSAIIDDADAFIFVLPEYNYSAPGSVKNAMDFLSQEWAAKPLGFISYGGISGGLRAVDSMLQALRAFKIVSLPEGVHISMFPKYFNDDGKFETDEHMEKAAQGMLNELARWGEALKGMREKK